VADTGEVKTIFGEGATPPREPDIEPLSKIIELLNEKFGINLSDADQLLFDQYFEDWAQDPELASQARNNTLANFKLVFDPKFLRTVVTRMDTNEAIFKRILDDAEFSELVRDYYLRKVPGTIGSRTTVVNGAPPSSPLDGALAKLERAKTHLAELESTIESLSSIASAGIVHNPAEDSRVHSYQAGGLPEIPTSLGVIVGEVLFNLRSCLDHVAWQLVLNNGGKPGERMSFPILGPPRKTGADPARTIRQLRVSTAAAEVIDSLQPYQREDFVNHHLWILNKLCNVDKHRMLLVSFFVPHIGSAWWGLPEGTTLLEFFILGGLIRQGEEIARFEFDRPYPGFDPHLSLTVRIEDPSIGFTPYFLSQPLQNVLSAITSFVSRAVVHQLSPLFK